MVVMGSAGTQREESVSGGLEKAKRVELSVGGQIFVTTVDTLSRDPACYFSSLLRGRYENTQSSGNNTTGGNDDRFFIDRDPTHFRYILNYLRDGTVRLRSDALLLHEIHQEASFYQVQGLLQHIEECQEQLETQKRDSLSKEKRYKVVFTTPSSFKDTFNHWTRTEGYDLESCLTISKHEMVLIFTRYYTTSDLMLFHRIESSSSAADRSLHMERLREQLAAASQSEALRTIFSNTTTAPPKFAARMDSPELKQKELDNMSKKERKLYMQKRRQQRHRDRQKQSEVEACNRIEELKCQNNRLVLYISFLAQRRCLQSVRLIQMRGLVMEIYGDYFRYGVDPHDREMHDKQATFLGFHFAPDCILHCPRRPRGYTLLLDQWKVYTILHDHFNAVVVAVRRMDEAGTVFSITQKIHLTMTHRAISMIYPHMLLDHDFMEKTINKVLVFKYSLIARFGSGNKIEAVKVQHELPQGWCRLLRDAAQTASLLRCAKVDEIAFILADYDTLAKKLGPIRRPQNLGTALAANV